jgi:hypothetical protein
MFLTVFVSALLGASVALAWDYIATGGGETRARACGSASVSASQVCSAPGQRADIGSCDCDQVRENWWECSLPYSCRGL